MGDDYYDADSAIALEVVKLVLAQQEEQEMAALAAVSLLAEEEINAKRPRAARAAVDREDRGLPETSPWQKKYVNESEDGRPHRCDDGNSRFGKQFRHNFRMPRTCWKQLVQRASEESWFPWVAQPDVTRRRGASLGLLTLAALAVLGRAVPFNMLEDVTCVHGQTIRKFFLAFVEKISAVMYDKFVCLPRTQDEFEGMTTEFREAGFDGAIGCTDGVQIPLKRCAYNLRLTRTGKEGYPTLGFNVTVTFRRRILYSTMGIPGAVNDQSKVLFDDLLLKIERGEVMFPWTRYSVDGATETRHRNYAITDNGYPKRPGYIMPEKYSSNVKHAKFSKFIESVRKCVECCFGILQVRFAILRDFRLHEEETLNHVFRTCCVLHNWLLERDGLDRPYTTDADHVADVERLQGSFAVPPQVADQEGEDADDEEERERTARVEEALDTWEHEHESHFEPIAGIAEETPRVAAAGVAHDDDEGQGAATTTSQGVASGAGGTAAPAVVQALEAYDVFFKKMSDHWNWKKDHDMVRWPSRA